MGLKEYQPLRHEIVLGGSSFHVRGLSLDDVSRLVNHHLPDLEALFELVASSDKIDFDNLRPLVVPIIQQAPGLAANLIALAADEPDEAQRAATLPFPVQVDTLVKIGDLTFHEVGGVGKAMETITALLSKTSLKPKLTKIGKKAE